MLDPEDGSTTSIRKICKYLLVGTTCRFGGAEYCLYTADNIYCHDYVRQLERLKCPVVTICTAQWSLYVPHSGHYMYRTVVTICTASLTFSNSTFCPTRCIYVFCVDLRTISHYFPYNIN